MARGSIVLAAPGNMNVDTREDFIVGRHVYGNLYGVSRTVLEDEKFLRRTVVEAAREGSMHIVDLKSWKFQGYHGGVSVIALVLESHVSIHTWPDYGYATVDVYTCGTRGDPWKAFNYIVLKLKPRKYRVHYADRSSIDEEMNPMLVDSEQAISVG